MYLHLHETNNQINYVECTQKTLLKYFRLPTSFTLCLCEFYGLELKFFARTQNTSYSLYSKIYKWFIMRKLFILFMSLRPKRDLCLVTIIFGYSFLWVNGLSKTFWLMTPSRGSIDEGFWEVVRWVRKYVWKYSEEMWHHVERGPSIFGLDDGWFVISEFYLKSYGFI